MKEIIRKHIETKKRVFIFSDTPAALTFSQLIECKALLHSAGYDTELYIYADNGTWFYRYTARRKASL